MDWSTSNILAVALDVDLYLWNAGTVEHLFKLDKNYKLVDNWIIADNYVSSVAWIQKGPYLAIGTNEGNIELWDCNQKKKIRVMSRHTFLADRVNSLAWNSHILTSGCRSGKILHHDVRQRTHLISTINTYSQQICGLRWSPSGQYLASGSIGMLQLWSITGRSVPLHTFEHRRAVKALA